MLNEQTYGSLLLNFRAIVSAEHIPTEAEAGEEEEVLFGFSW